MHLARLRITDFRNLVEQRLEIPPAGLAIIGDNGQGKTNLLEAIYYLQIFRSFRGSPDEQLVRFGADVFRVEGRVEGLGEADRRTIAAGYDRKLRTKRVTIDGVEVPRLAEGIGRLGVVIFSPSDVALVSGGPAVRRRFLDILLSLTEPGYLDDLQRYRQILLQRNAALRNEETRELVSAWDGGLVRAGSRVTMARWGWVAARAADFAAHVRHIAGGTEALLDYQPSVAPGADGEGADLRHFAGLFAAELTRVAERERRRGTTLVGPHRDDLRIRAARGGDEWVDLRSFGSGGQQRTAAVALRMIEGQTLRDRLGSDPVILLDDVFAELDPGRSRRILEWVEGEDRAQVILTTPKRADFQLRGGSLAAWSIAEGKLAPL